MSGWFRSELMTYVSIIVNEDAAHKCMNEIGKLGVIQFTDLNPELTPFQRRYVSFIKRIDELERKLKFFGDQMHKFGLRSVYKGEVDSFIVEGDSTTAKSGVQLLENLETEMEKEETVMLELNQFNKQISSEYEEKIEFQEVLENSLKFFTSDELNGLEDGIEGDSNTYQAQDLEDGPKKTTEFKFSYTAGIVSMEEKTRFARQIYRSTRNNCLVNFDEIDLSKYDKRTYKFDKLSFLIFYKSTAIENKIAKICDAFGAKRYPLPNMEDTNKVLQLLEENRSEIVDSKRVLDKNKDARRSICVSISDRIEYWNWITLREKACYHALNAFKPDVKGMLRGEGWVLGEALPLTQVAVRNAHESMGAGMPSFVEVMPYPWPTPPTYFKTNVFTYAFQEFVDTYGVPRYQEANPALFAAATFPFLYGVMYGDIGHGFCIFAYGLFLIWSYSRRTKGRKAEKDDEMMGGMYSARYMIAMMGAFSVYCGVIYNDWFAIAVNLFGTTWKWADDAQLGDEAVHDSEYGDPNGVYPFGMDPSWHIAENELLFYNSMKMKMSVVLGIIQMTTGILLKASNARYFKQPLDYWCEFVPMIIFDLSLFGYMVVLIFMKWSINWEDRMYQGSCDFVSGLTPGGALCNASTTTAQMCPLDYGGEGDGCQPPNLITTLINIALAPGSVDEPMYKNQDSVQLILLFVAFICVPVILLAKPIMIKRQMKHQHQHSDLDSASSDTHLVQHQQQGHDDHNFSEIVIHQAIETIEFVLGMVSNTASYLRLWALSLAHTELATVFWEKALLVSIETENPFFVFVGFAVWFAVTFGVLLCMDVLECFLHALRLHWVEFQNKFYKADGYKFQPFSLVKVLESAPRY